MGWLLRSRPIFIGINSLCGINELFLSFISSHKFKKCHLILVAEHWRRVKKTLSCCNCFVYWILIPEYGCYTPSPFQKKSKWFNRLHNRPKNVRPPFFPPERLFNYAERLSSLPQMQERGLFAIVAYAGRRLTPQVRWDRQSRRVSNFWSRTLNLAYDNILLSNRKKFGTLNLVK